MRACRVGLLSLLTLFGIQAVAHAQLATLLKDIRPTQWSAASDPVFLGSVDGLTYFSATAAGIGRELWTTDGTPEGTLLFDDRCPGTCGSVYIALGIANDHLFHARRIRCRGRAHERPAGRSTCARGLQGLCRLRGVQLW